ncbi:uncharacterized protein LOC134295913 [Anolis carolinensis]|uniref:uncharacterized protein LOC134295913 n=1 Tax=Anolis carolinensis TaxID=28377 RepID=UPI002F2B4D07
MLYNDTLKLGTSGGKKCSSDTSSQMTEAGSRVHDAGSGRPSAGSGRPVWPIRRSNTGFRSLRRAFRSPRQAFRWAGQPKEGLKKARKARRRKRGVSPSSRGPQLRPQNDCATGLERIHIPMEEVRGRCVPSSRLRLAPTFRHCSTHVCVQTVVHIVKCRFRLKGRSGREPERPSFRALFFPQHHWGQTRRVGAGFPSPSQPSPLFRERYFIGKEGREGGRRQGGREEEEGVVTSQQQQKPAEGQPQSRLPCLLRPLPLLLLTPPDSSPQTPNERTGLPLREGKSLSLSLWHWSRGRGGEGSGGEESSPREPGRRGPGSDPPESQKSRGNHLMWQLHKKTGGGSSSSSSSEPAKPSQPARPAARETLRRRHRGPARLLPPSSSAAAAATPPPNPQDRCCHHLVKIRINFFI